MEPIRNILRHKKAIVKFYEAEATKIDYENRLIYMSDDSEIKGDVSHTVVPFDMLVVGVGAENATFGTSDGVGGCVCVCVRANVADGHFQASPESRTTRAF